MEMVHLWALAGRSAITREREGPTDGSRLSTSISIQNQSAKKKACNCKVKVAINLLGH